MEFAQLGSTLEIPPFVLWKNFEICEGGDVHLFQLSRFTVKHAMAISRTPEQIRSLVAISLLVRQHNGEEFVAISPEAVLSMPFRWLKCLSDELSKDVP